jgi:hypothetical protein
MVDPLPTLGLSKEPGGHFRLDVFDKDSSDREKSEEGEVVHFSA